MLLKHLKKYNPETFKALNLDLGFYSPKFVTYGNVWRFWSFILHPDKLISSEDSEALSRIAVVRRLFIYYFGLFFICIFTMISLALMDYSLQQPSSFGELTDFHGWLSFVKSFLQPLIFTLGGHMILLSLLWTLMFYGIYNQLRRYEPEMCMQLQLPVKLSELSLRDNLTLGIFILFSSKWTHITKPGTIRAIIVARGILFICDNHFVLTNTV